MASKLAVIYRADIVSNLANKLALRLQYNGKLYGQQASHIAE